MTEAQIREIVSEVVGQLKNGPAAAGQSATDRPKAVLSPQPKRNAPPVDRASRYGVFEEPEAAARAAYEGFQQLQSKGWAARKVAVQRVKDLCAHNAKSWGKLEFEETKIGRLEHKVAKLEAIPDVPGVEALAPVGMSGDLGITMDENAPWGVILAITPVTHSIPTIAGNLINMIAAGNAVVINPHPGGARCAAAAVEEFNKAIEAATGISHLITIVRKPTLESFEALCKSEHVALLCVTGGPGVVAAAMKSGKRAICAGPGNPPVVVDSSADLDRAARAIIEGGGFDNNLLCIGEKQVFVVDEVFGDFVQAMQRAGAASLASSELEKITAEAFTVEEKAGSCASIHLNRELVGVDASRLGRIAGKSVSPDCMMLFAETDEEHAYVVEEQMMPLIPLIRCPDIGAAITAAKKSEHGYRHSAMIHTRDVEAMTRMGRAMDTTLFVKNGPSTAGLGLGGEGFLSFSVATTTGEGITTPRTFTRYRRCTLVESLNIV